MISNSSSHYFFTLVSLIFLARGGEQIQGNSIFWKWQSSSTSEFIVVVIVWTRPFKLNSNRMGERRKHQHCILIRKHVCPFSTFPFNPGHPENGFFEISKRNIENIQYIVWIIFKILFHYLLHTVLDILPQFTKTNARLLLKDSNTLKMSILRTSAQISMRISDHLLIMLLFHLHKTQMFETQMFYIPTE